MELGHKQPLIHIVKYIFKTLTVRKREKCSKLFLIEFLKSG